MNLTISDLIVNELNSLIPINSYDDYIAIKKELEITINLFVNKEGYNNQANYLIINRMLRSLAAVEHLYS